MTTVDKIKRLYNLFYVVLTLEVVVLIAIFIGNPFDFKYTIQFVPYMLLLTGVVIAFLNLLHISRSIDKLSAGSRMDHYLKGIVSIYNQNTRFEKWFGVIFLSVGLLIPLSFLPQKLDRVGLTRALMDTAIMMSMTLIFYIAAFKLGAFKNTHKDKLEKDLAEWKKLKELADEMQGEHSA